MACRPVGLEVFKAPEHMGPSDVCVCMCVMVHLLSDDGPADLPSMRKLGGDEAIFGEVAPSPGHVPAGFCPP